MKPFNDSYDRKIPAHIGCHKGWLGNPDYANVISGCFYDPTWENNN